MTDSLVQLARRMLEKTVVRYAIAGAATFVVNFGSMAIFLETFGWEESRLLRNLAHAIGTELSFLFAFHVHNWWTWKNAEHGNYWVKIFQFHLATGLTFVLRQIGFDLLTEQADWHWLPATIVPLILAIMINYVVYNFFIFRNRSVD